MSARISSCPLAAYRGFSLIEVLVTLVLLGLGLLGAQQLHAMSMRENRAIQQQATADRLAADLAERMRGNSAMAIALDSPYWMDTTVNAPPPLPSPDCVSQPCLLPQQAAARDAAEWQHLVAQQLPGARVQVCPAVPLATSRDKPDWSCTPTSGSPVRLVTIKLGWRTRQQPEPLRPGTVLVVSTGASVP